MKLTKYIMACILAFSLAGCIDDEPSNNPITYGDGYITVLLSTDKAAYQPGEPVQLSLNLSLIHILWNSSLDETLEFEARVTAAVLGHEEFTQVSPVVTFKLTPYIERYLNLWMIGGATVGGWSLDNATPMESIEDEPNGFVWEGVLLSGERCV